MGNSSSSARARGSVMDETSGKEAGGTAATPPSSSGASCASSFEKTVLLHDWWLIKAHDECSRERLAVGGLVTTGKAVRIFKSAPIVKRYDGYTLETADGITVRIQGLINASRMLHNGFPSDACDHFRIGFPFNWKDYGERYFRTETKDNDVPICASDNHDCSTDSANTTSYDFPVHLKESSVGRIVDFLNSICKEIVDDAQRRSDASTTQNLSENNHNNENTNGIVTQADYNIDGNMNGAEENVYVATLPENDALGMNSFLDGLTKSNKHVSDDSSLCGSVNISSPLEKVTGFQESSAMAVMGPDNEKQRVGPISIDPDDVVKAMNGNMCCINAIPAPEFGAEVLLSKSLLENGEESESVAPKEDHLTNENTNGIVTQADHNIDGNMNGAEENVYVATLPENDALGMNSFLDGLNHVSDDSSLCGSVNISSPLEKVTGFQKESSAMVVMGPDNEKQRVGPISIDLDDVAKAMNGNMCCINAIPAPEFGPEVLLSKSLLENGEESESVAPKEDHLTKEAERVICFSESMFMLHKSDVEVMNSPRMQLEMVLVNPVSSDAVSTAKRTRNSLKKGYVKSSSLLASQNCAGMYRNQGEAGDINDLDEANIGFTRVSKEPLCTETNEMHLEVSVAMGDHSHTAVKDALLHEGHRFDETNTGSVASMMVTSKGTPTKHVAMADSFMKDVRGKLSCSLRSATKMAPSSVFEKDVNQPMENGELNLFDSNMMDFGSERVLVECSYGETNDMQPESSVKVAGCASNSVRSHSSIRFNIKESTIDSPHVGVTISEPLNKQFSLRRSERLLKLKNSAEDKQISLQLNKRSINKIASKSMSYETQNGKSSTLSINKGTSMTEGKSSTLIIKKGTSMTEGKSSTLILNKGTSMTEGSHLKSADVLAAVARKLNFPSRKSLHDCGTTSIEGILHTGLEGNNISSKKQDVEAIQGKLLKSRPRYGGYSQKNSGDSREENQSVVDTGKNQVLFFSDCHDFMNSENAVTESHDLPEDRIEADKQNLDVPMMEQSISDIGIDCVVGHVQEAHCSDVPVDIQPNGDKSSGKAAKKSTRKPHFAPQIVKTPLTRQRTKELSFASPELLNFRRSRSGRLIIPTLDNWCQQILYDMDGSVAGIFTGMGAINCDRRGSRSQPPKKKKKIV